MKRGILAVLAAGVCFGKCASISPTGWGSDVKITSMELVAASGTMPEHCDIRGVIWPEAGFALKLPANWNKRFQMVGGGGWAGVLSLDAVDQAVRAGYAAASTDTGHDDKKEPGAIFAYPSAENPNAARKVVDFGYLAVHETVLLSKKMIHAYYASDPQYSYWVGCSTGGRQGLMEAQRYPEDFDGYVVGAPVLYLSGLQAKGMWVQRAIAEGPGLVKPEKLPLLAKAVYEKCDAADGLKDGLIDNPLRCNFDPTKDLARCAGDSDNPTCFTGAQIEGLKKVYEGPRDSKGRQLFPGTVVGSEVLAPGPGGRLRSLWDGNLTNPLRLPESFLKYMAFDPPAGPNWDYHTFDFDRDWQNLASVGLRIDATIPDLSAVKARGGKILHYHGWSDPGVPATMSVNYYTAAKKAMGPKETDDFYRLFLVPGMGHCRGGVGCGDVDWLAPLVSWVEQGVAPVALRGARNEAGKTTRTRPICAYPNVAQYKGAGSVDAAENFTCGSPGL